MVEPNSEALDLIGSELVREDPSFVHLVVQFVDRLGERVDNMEQAIRAADFDALRVAAHQLRGSGGGYGYPILTDQAAKLEEEAKTGALENCVEALAQLRRICERIVVRDAEQATHPGINSV